MEDIVLKDKQEIIDRLMGNTIMVANFEFGSSNHGIHLPSIVYEESEPMKREIFDNMMDLQKPMNLIAMGCSKDHDLLSSVSEKVSKTDEFTRRTYEIYEKSRKQPNRQPVELGIFRSDYMRSVKGEQERFFQIELNTISSSFGALSSKLAKFHKWVMEKRGHSSSGLVVSESLDKIVYGLGEALKLYEPQTNKPLIGVLVEIEGEKNRYDQLPLQFGVEERYGFTIKRYSLNKIHQLATKGTNGALIIEDQEVGLVYFRAGYSPDHYTSEEEWKARELIELSYAIKCPTAAYQLAGMKKIQQEIAQPGAVEKYLGEEESKKVRKCFAGLYPLNEQTIEMAKKDPNSFVLKPQREGGGNNYYGNEVVTKLESTTEDEWDAYILMERVFPPTFTATAIRNGEIKKGEMVSEYGIYGILLTNGDKVAINEEAGYLTRTKFANTNEGGVAAGYAFLNTITKIGRAHV